VLSTLRYFRNEYEERYVQNTDSERSTDQRAG